MRHIVFGILICTLVSTIWGKPLESSTTAPTGSTEKTHMEPGKPSVTTPAVTVAKKTNNENPHSEAATTTKRPEPVHATTEKNASNPNKNTKETTVKPNEKEVVTSTVKPHTAKANKDAITQKPQKTEEPKHKTGGIESQIDDLLNEGDLSMDRLEEMILDGSRKISLKKWNGYSLQIDGLDSSEDK